jgi:hypothetical protein
LEPYARNSERMCSIALERTTDRLDNAASPKYRSMVDQAKRGMSIISKNAVAIEKPIARV